MLTSSQKSKVLKKAISNTVVKVLDFCLVLSAVLGSFVLLATIPKSGEGELLVQFIINSVVVITIIIIAVFRKRINYRIKAYVVLLILFIVTYVDLLLYGLLSANKVFFIVIPIFSNMIFNIRKTVRIFIFANLLFSAIAYLIIFDVNPFLQELDRQSYDALDWFINYLELVIVATAILVLFHHYNVAVLGSYAELDEHKNVLESTVEERTQELNLKNKELRKSNITKDLFFSIIAHDMKAPMNQMITFIDLFKNEYKNMSEEMKEKLINNVSEASHLGIKLLENLLEWAMAQTGELKYNPVKIDFKQILERVIKLFAQSAMNKNIEIENLVTQDIVLYADENMLRSVLRNLISNGIKFTPDGGKVSIKAGEDKKAFVFSVKDTGIGMDKQAIDKLFKMDETHSTLGTNNEKGTGLGLLLCKDFIEKHGGSIGVKGELGMGCEFSFSIPKLHA